MISENLIKLNFVVKIKSFKIKPRYWVKRQELMENELHVISKILHVEMSIPSENGSIIACNLEATGIGNIIWYTDEFIKANTIQE